MPDQFLQQLKASAGLCNVFKRPMRLTRDCRYGKKKHHQPAAKGADMKFHRNIIAMMAAGAFALLASGCHEWDDRYYDAPPPPPNHGHHVTPGHTPPPPPHVRPAPDRPHPGHAQPAPRPDHKPDVRPPAHKPDIKPAVKPIHTPDVKPQPMPSRPDGDRRVPARPGMPRK